nr:MAG TPA: hypothetical protein [Caudoviricetes sp.]
MSIPSYNIKLWWYTVIYRYTIDIYKYHKKPNLSNLDKNPA